VWSLVIAASLGNLLWAAFSVVGPVVADRDLGGAAVWGTVMAAMGVGALAGALVAIRVRSRRLLVLSLLSLTTFALPPRCSRRWRRCRCWPSARFARAAA
jgi:hypothetical protein